MPNELYDSSTIKKNMGPPITFTINCNVDTLWMNQTSLCEFFETPFKELIQGLTQCLEHPTILASKENHLRRISYVKKASSSLESIQETQYSFFVICLLAFKLDSVVAKAFQTWIINTQLQVTKNGFILDKQRILNSEKRLKRFKNQSKKINTLSNDQP